MRNICTIEGCERLVASHGLCSMHWKRWKRHGDPLHVKRIIGDTERRLWSKVDKDGPIPESRPDLGPCWIWIAYINASGYGVVGLGQKTKLAHRLAYEVRIGPIPPGLEIDHLCRVRCCVNPSHLEQTTRAENVRRAAKAKVPQTHCKRGHPLSGENLRVSKEGSRICRTCNIEAQRRWRGGQGKCIAS